MPFSFGFFIFCPQNHKEAVSDENVVLMCLQAPAAPWTGSGRAGGTQPHLGEWLSQPGLSPAHSCSWALSSPRALCKRGNQPSTPREHPWTLHQEPWSRPGLQHPRSSSWSSSSSSSSMLPTLLILSYLWV